MFQRRLNIHLVLSLRQHLLPLTFLALLLQHFTTTLQVTVMPSDSGNRRPTKPHQVGAPPSEPEHLPCPRCDSTNTKFCYYNNYNLSQPRHFCKSCRRYWTHGGTLRDIPVGGGSRKNAKRSRTTPNSATYTHDNCHVPATTNPILLPLVADHGGASSPFLVDGKPGLNICGSFTSLLNTQGPGLLALGGFGIGPGFEGRGLELGRAVWPFPGVVGDGSSATSGGGGVASTIGNGWQLESGEGGFFGGDCFSLPDFAISNGVKSRNYFR